MLHRLLWIAGVLALAGGSVHGQAKKQADDSRLAGKATAKPDYAHDIRPLFAARCVVCHNRSALANPTLSGGLALDSPAAIRTGVTGKMPKPVLIAGKSAESELVRRLVTSSPGLLMPKGGPPLPAAQIALVRRWIDAGAPEGAAPVPAADRKPADPASLPLPVAPATQEVLLNTVIAPTPDMVTRDSPRDATLALGWKIGPLAPITALAYSPDGTRLAAGGYRTVFLWDTKSGNLLGCLTGLTGAVQSLAFRPDGAQIAVAGGLPGASGEVKIYDIKTLLFVPPALNGHGDVVYSVAWDSEGRRLLTGSQDKTARLWEWPSAKELRAMKESAEAVTRVGFAPDGKTLYTAGYDRVLRRIDASSGQVQKVFSGHGDAVLAFALSPDGKGLVSSGPEPRLRWWNPDSGETSRYSDGHGDLVNEIVFRKDGKTMASASADKTVRIWDGANGGAQKVLRGAGDWLYSVALSPDGKYAAGAGAEGVVRIWEIEKERLRLTLAAWPASGKAPADWLAVTPEGYFDGSAGWIARMRPMYAGSPATQPAVKSLLPALHDPEKVLKSWQGAALEPAKLVAPPPYGPPKPSDPPSKPNTGAPASKPE